MGGGRGHRSAVRRLDALLRLGQLVASLVCAAHATHAWACGVRFVRGARGPLPTFVWLALLLTSGYVYGVLGGLVLMLGVLVGAAVRRDRTAALLRLAAVGAAAALCSAVTFLPAALSAGVTFREVHNLFTPEGLLVVPWSEALGATVPTYTPQVLGFTSQEQTPSTWTAWFVVPLLPLLSVERLRRRAGDLAGPLFVVVVMLAVTSGPAFLGPFRWPARMLPFLAIALLVLVAVAASTRLEVSRARLTVAAGLVGLGAVRAMSLTAPEPPGRHLVALALVLALSAAVLVVRRWRGEGAVGWCVALTVLPVLALQLQHFPHNLNFYDWNFPSDVERAQAEFMESEGWTLQLADTGLIPDEERNLAGAWDSLVAANYARGLDLDYVNAYTPLGFKAFREPFCMSELGTTCVDARDTVFSREPTTGLVYADLLAVDRVVLQRRQFPKAAGEPAPAGWQQTAVDAVVVVLERTRDDGRSPGGVALSEDVALAETQVEDRSVSATVTSVQGGSVVFSRLAWPGYEATLGGRSLSVRAVDELFVAVDVPAGTAGEVLRLEYTPPGWEAGRTAAVLGGLVLLCLVAQDLVRRRRLRPVVHAP